MGSGPVAARDPRALAWLDWPLMFDHEDRRKLDRVLALVETLVELHHLERLTIMSALEDLTAQVAATVTIEASAVQVIAGIADQIKAAGTDPAKLAALSSELNASAAKLAAAISANTPAAPPVAPPVVAPAPVEPAPPTTPAAG